MHRAAVFFSVVQSIGMREFSMFQQQPMYNLASVYGQININGAIFPAQIYLPGQA